MNKFHVCFICTMVHPFIFFTYCNKVIPQILYSLLVGLDFFHNFVLKSNICQKLTRMTGHSGDSSRSRCLFTARWTVFIKNQ